MLILCADVDVDVGTLGTRVQTVREWIYIYTHTDLAIVSTPQRTAHNNEKTVNMTLSTHTETWSFSLPSGGCLPY